MDLRENYIDSENRHPWEVSRFQFFSKLVRQTLPAEKNTSVLDVGCGDGWMSLELASQLSDSRFTCWDPALTPLDLGNLNTKHPRVSFHSEKPSNRFNLILFMDVLEHAKDDFGLLKQCVENNLAPGGRVLISVPAWPFLFSAHDRFLHHHRRYTYGSATALVSAAGLHRVKTGGLFYLLLPIRLAEKCLEQWGKERPEASDSQAISQRHLGFFMRRIIKTVLWGDHFISMAISGLRIPIPGLTWWALCEKRS
jgi:2-polyprenyl-3-methyl-5-hydroxy-6-metoxy-1,4-benzoquinol methylase